MKKIEINVKNGTQVIKAKLKSGLDAGVEFIGDHSEEIFYGVVIGACAVVYGQTIRYMHYLNRDAKKGIFHYFPVTK